MVWGRYLTWFLFWTLSGWMAAADTLRVAQYNVELDRSGPGVLLRDILAEEAQVTGIARVLAVAKADVILLTRFDYDAGLVALRAFNDLLGPLAYDHVFALRPNTGRPSSHDLDRDGRLGEPEDMQSFAAFAGQNGMAILSRFPIAEDDVRDFSDVLWADVPDATLPTLGGDDFWPKDVAEDLRLSTVGHWDVPLILPNGGRLHLWAFHAAPPVFDGPEDRNGLRAADEVRFWQLYMDGALLVAPTQAPFVILGTSNIDPHRGEGRKAAMRSLLSDPRLQDPRPVSPGARALGHPSDTVDWADAVDAGNLRVDYVLPDRRLSVRSSGVLWPTPETDEPDFIQALDASRHRLVWIDLNMPP